MGPPPHPLQFSTIMIDKPHSHHTKKFNKLEFVGGSKCVSVILNQTYPFFARFHLWTASHFDIPKRSPTALLLRLLH